MKPKCQFFAKTSLVCSQISGALRWRSLRDCHGVWNGIRVILDDTRYKVSYEEEKTYFEKGIGREVL